MVIMNYVDIEKKNFLKETNIMLVKDIIADEKIKMFENVIARVNDIGNVLLDCYI